MDEIKERCPFCGDELTVRKELYTPNLWSLYCHEAVCMFHIRGFPTEQAAIEFGNRRYRSNEAVIDLSNLPKKKHKCVIIGGRDDEPEGVANVSEIRKARDMAKAVYEPLAKSHDSCIKTQMYEKGRMDALDYVLQLAEKQPEGVTGWVAPEAIRLYQHKATTYFLVRDEKQRDYTKQVRITKLEGK